jgi:hypothetical protein
MLPTRTIYKTPNVRRSVRRKKARHQWLMPVILAPEEAEIRRIKV